jgi:hypothetical protein
MAAKQAAMQPSSGPLFELPGRDQLIANVAMDFAARRYNRLGEIEDETI